MTDKAPPVHPKKRSKPWTGPLHWHLGDNMEWIPCNNPLCEVDN